MNVRTIRRDTAIIDYLVVTDLTGDLLAGLTDSDFTKEVTLDGSPTSLAITVTEVNAVTRKGWYKVEFTSPDSGKTLLIVLKNATFFAEGKFAQYDMTTLDLSSGGANTITLMIEDTDGDPIEGVFATIKNEEETVTLITGLVSDSLGVIVTSLDDGTYKVILSKGGVTFTVPETLVVSGDTTKTIVGTIVTIDVPTGAELIVVFGNTTDLIGAIVPGYRLTFEPVGENLYTKGGLVVDTSPRDAVADQSGFFQITLVKTQEIDITKSSVSTSEARHRLTHGPRRETRDFQTPDATSVNVADLIFDLDKDIL